MSFPTNHETGSSSSLDSPQPCRQLTFSEIQVATQNFDRSLVIGRGGFGKVYKGTITYRESLLTVAIKRLDSKSNQGASEFWAEVKMLSDLRHSNLVSLIGYCKDGGELILVYEYMPNGTLADRLHKGKAPLTWMRRLKICLGAARGLEYLHATTDIKPTIIHQDVKSSNILLDRNWAARISDFGLSKVGPTNQSSATFINTNVRGTFGYLDPDYFQTGRLTRRSDVYAFGVVLFEILSGKEAVFEAPDKECKGLASWAQDSIKEGKLKQIIDHNLSGVVSSKCVKEFAQLANQCLHDHPKKRPTMAEVVVGLESILATHEKTSDNALLSMDKKIFGRKIPAFLVPSNRENSVGSLKSLELYLYTVGGEDRILGQFDFKTIVDATENFSKANEVVGGMYERYVYKGRLQNGQHITIVRYGPDDSIRECMDEALIHVKVEHENLLQLLGYCVEGRTTYLVYDFALYARLDCLMFDRYLHTNRAPLNWNARYKIILGVAQALVYLHNHAPVRIIHGDVKPSNIWLSESLDPKLVGFDFAMSNAINQITDFEMEIIRGTPGYKASEVFRNHLADVFGFGVFILETIRGSKLSDRARDMEEIWRYWMQGFYTNLTIIDSSIISDGEWNSITKLIHIGLLCVQYEATNCPTMEEIVSMILNSSCASLPIPRLAMINKD